MATPNYSINYDDKRFAEVKADEKAALNEVDVTYGNMINNSDKFYKQQIDAAKQYGEQQKKIQNEQTDFAIEQINQQKAQAKQDYTKEQSGAYVDWQKQSNEYGAQAEQRADMGMQNTGYSESSQVSMYNTYQNRVATAREAYSRAVLNYDNAIKDARLQNNAALAEIAYNTLRAQLELSLEGFQYKNSLIMAKSDKRLALESEYHDRYQDVLAQINHENSLAEEVRQYNESLAEEKRQYDATMKFQKEQFDEEVRQFNILHPATTSSSSSSSARGKVDKDYTPNLYNKRKQTQLKINKNNNKNKSTDLSKLKEPVTDMKSVLKLGLGPISAENLDYLVRSGLVKEYESGNMLKYKLSAEAQKQKNLLKNTKITRELR